MMIERIKLVNKDKWRINHLIEPIELQLQISSLEKFGFDSVHKDSQFMVAESHDEDDNRHKDSDIFFKYKPCA